MRTDHHLPHFDKTHATIGGFYSVHDHLGYGFHERVYANSLAVCLTAAGHAVEREVPFTIIYRGVPVGRYVADMVVDSVIVVEAKTGRAIHSEHIAQLANYLRASGLDVGLLLNFGVKPEFRRVMIDQRTVPRAIKQNLKR